MFTVYVLKSLKDNRYYIGYTSNLSRRLEEHNRGKNQSVRNRGPFEVVYQEEIENKTNVILRERQIKSYKGGNAFKRLVGTLK